MDACILATAGEVVLTNEEALRFRGQLAGPPNHCWKIPTNSSSPNIPQSPLLPFPHLSSWMIAMLAARKGNRAEVCRCPRSQEQIIRNQVQSRLAPCLSQVLMWRGKKKNWSPLASFSHQRDREWKI